MELKIAGIDPSLRNFGYAKGIYDVGERAFEVKDIDLQQTENESGKTVRKSSDDFRCASLLHNKTQEWITGCNVVFGEVPSGAQSARAAFGLGIALGVIAGVGNVRNEFRGRLIQVTPLDVKRLAVGSKNASKEEMIEWAAELWPNLPWLTDPRSKIIVRGMKLQTKNEHMADACAAINAGVQTDEFLSLVEAVKNLAA